MPYNKRSELPDQVKDNVPPHAQDIYKEAFNNAIDQYDGDEERAHATAWAAVKQKYEKDEDSGRWKRKDND
ncbi:MAG: cation transporter [Sphaerobacteraceae bacterium]|nr:MAG: cation transporter [Sphaerobacteraceae bacterium]